jgi:hypothetical protein
MPLIHFLKEPRGLNLVSPSALVQPNEFIKGLNLKVNHFGQLVTREGLKKLTTTACGAAIKHIAYLPVGSNTYYIFVIDADNKIYKISGAEGEMTPGNSLGTLEGEATIVPFNGYGIILDTGYIKTTQGTSVDMAYDNGEGIAGYQHCGLCRELEASTALYYGSQTVRGALFTTQAWTTGKTIPLKRLDIWISKTGDPDGAIVAKLCDSDGGNCLATSSTSYDKDDLTSNPMQMKFYFDDDYGMSPETSYRAVVLYAEGDIDNCVNVHHDVVDSGGDGVYYEGSWQLDALADIALGVKPGKPPKASFGAIKDLRLFAGGDSDNPGYMWFSNLNTVFDWSTPKKILSTNTGYTGEGAGYVGCIDDDANAFPLGAILPLYGDLWIIGKSKQPFLSKLIGKTPDDFRLPPLFQHTHTEHKTAQGLPNDLWFTSSASVHHMLGVQEYGDIRTFSPGDPIKKKIETYFDSDAFAGYNPVDGQYLLKLTGYDNILVCHTAHPLKGNKFIWTAYKFKGLTPSSFSSFLGHLYVGCTNGHLYRLDETIVEDDGTLPDVELKTGILEFPFEAQHLDKMFLKIVSDAAASAMLSFYKNGDDTCNWHKELEISTASIQNTMGYTCKSLQLYLHDLVYTKEVVVQDLLFHTRHA